MKPVIIRTEEEIAELQNLAAEAIDEGTNFPGSSYEQGVHDTILWLLGDNDEPPLP